MTDDLERRLRDWMHEDGDVPMSELSRVAATISTLPSHDRARGRLAGLAAAAVLVLVVVLGVAVTLPGIGFVGGTATEDPARSRGGKLPTPDPAGNAPPVQTSMATPAPTPPDPAAFSGDPRLLMCGRVGVVPIEFVFEMRHAADYRRYLPAMLLAPELDVTEPALVVIYRGDLPLAAGGAAPPPGKTWPPRSLEPGHRDVCIVVGADQLNYYENVDITGMRVSIPADGSSPGPTPTPSSTSEATIGPVATPTPSPAPAITQAPTEPVPTASPS